jgi:hypothetical protein
MTTTTRRRKPGPRTNGKQSGVLSEIQDQTRATEGPDQPTPGARQPLAHIACVQSAHDATQPWRALDVPLGHAPQPPRCASYRHAPAPLTASAPPPARGPNQLSLSLSLSRAPPPSSAKSNQTRIGTAGCCCDRPRSRRWRRLADPQAPRPSPGSVLREFSSGLAPAPSDSRRTATFRFEAAVQALRLCEHCGEAS